MIQKISFPRLCHKWYKGRESARAVQVWMVVFINCYCFHYNWKIWRDAFTVKQKSPYMSHLFPSCTVHGMQFCPFEDVLGVGHSQGFGSLLVPGKTCIFIGESSGSKTMSAYHLYWKPGNPGENLNGWRFIPVKIFRKKSNTFRGITFFPF